MRNRRDTFTWAFLFVVLTVLSLDYWWWGAATTLGVMGLPVWVFYFVLLQFALAAGVYFFSKHYWDEDEDDGGDTTDGGGR